MTDKKQTEDLEVPDAAVRALEVLDEHIFIPFSKDVVKNITEASNDGCLGLYDIELNLNAENINVMASLSDVEISPYIQKVLLPQLKAKGVTLDIKTLDGNYILYDLDWHPNKAKNNEN